MSFLFGGNTGMTQEQIEQRRRLAAQMLAANNQTPQNYGEGLHSIARAIAGRIMQGQADRGSQRLMRDEELMGAKIAQAQAPDMPMQAPTAGPAADTADPRASVASALMGGAGNDMLGGGNDADMLMPMDPATLPPQMVPSPGMVPEMDVRGTVQFPGGQARGGLDAMTAGMGAPQGPNAGTNPMMGAAMASGGYRAPVRAPAPPADEDLMGAEMEFMRRDFERQPAGKRVMRQDIRALSPDEGRATGAPSTGSGEVILTDPNSPVGMRMDVIPGSAAERELLAEQERQQGRQLYSDTYATALFDNIQAARELAESTWFTNGAIGNMTRNIGGTPANNMQALVTPIISAIGLDRLGALREQSATGASGLGQLSAPELNLLVNGLYSLEQSQSESQFLQNLERVEDALARLQYGPPPQGVSTREWIAQNAGGAPPQAAPAAAPTGGVPPVPEGVDPADWQYMTPEERALFQ